MTVAKSACCLMLIGYATVGAASPGETKSWNRVGPEGGNILRLASDPLNPSTLYAGTCAGLFRSTDGAVSWTAVPELTLPALYVPGCFSFIEIDVQNAGTIYAGGSSGLLKSTDGGDSWKSIQIGANARMCTQMTIPSNCSQSLALESSSTLYVAGNGILKSTDGGDTWTRPDAGFFVDNLLNALVTDPKSVGTIYAAGSRGLFKSTDGGVSWSLSHPAPAGSFGTIVIDPQDSGIVYYASTAGIAKSLNGGADWNDITPNLGTVSVAGSTFVRTVALNPLDPATVVALLYQRANQSIVPSQYFECSSPDGGATWMVSAGPGAGSDLHSIAFDLQDHNARYLGTSNGVLKNDGGGGWRYANSGLRAVPVNQVLVDPVDGALSAPSATLAYPFFQQNALFRSADRGGSWSVSGEGMPNVHGLIVSHQRDSKVLYTVGQYLPPRAGGNGLFRSDDGGIHWRQVWSRNFDGQTWFSLPALDPRSADQVYIASATCFIYCNYSLLKSTDGGRSWIQWPITLAEGPELLAITVDPGNSDTLYTGNFDSVGCCGSESLWKSVDGGRRWTSIARTGDVSFVLVDPQDSNTVYYADALIHKSTDGGQSWTTILKNYDILVIDPENSQSLYAGCSGLSGPSCGDILRSTDAGATWTSIGPGLGGSLRSLTIATTGPKTLYAATNGGLFAIPTERQ